MDATLDLSRWRERPLGLGYRRWAIVSAGLRQLLRTRFFLVLLSVAWVAGLAIAALGFAFAQSLSTGGWLETLAANIGPRAQALVSALGGLVLMYPEICIDTVYTSIFWLHSFAGLYLSLVALTAIVPRLVAQDRASQALTIYLSRPLTSTDYLLGKLGIIVALLLLLWTGPLVLGWGLGMALAPSRDFVVHSCAPFLRALLFNGISLVVLASVAFGVSAVNRTARGSRALWIGVWIVAGTIAQFPATPAWLARASFSRDLDEVRRTVFALDSALREAGTTLPLLGPDLTQNLQRNAERVRPRDFEGALLGLGVLTAASAALFLRRLRPE